VRRQLYVDPPVQLGPHPWLERSEWQCPPEFLTTASSLGTQVIIPISALLNVTQGIVSTIQGYVMTLYRTQSKSTQLMGYCLYEYSDEAYLNGNFGIYMVTPTNHPSGQVLYNEATGITQVSYGSFPSVQYPVNKLFSLQSTSGVSLNSAIQQSVLVVSARESW
jgi:hypothetical protein